MFDLSRLLSSVASDAIGLRRKRGRRAMGFLGGPRRSFLGTSSVLGLAGLAVGAYQIFKDKSAASATSARPHPPASQARVQAEPPSPAPFAPPLPASADPDLQVDDLPLRAVRLMIAAARCDGALGEEELAELASHARDGGLEAQMRAEWQSPRPLAEICAGVGHPAQKRDLYVLAYTVLRADDEVSGAEKVFLAQLAARLGLAPAEAASIEHETARQIDLAG